MKSRISILLIIVVGLLAASCDDFLEVNSDPNNPTEVSPNLVLPVGLNYTATYVQQNRGLNHLGNMMMFNFGEANGFSWYSDEFNYTVNSTFYTQLFDNAYSQALKQYKILENRPEGYYKAIGMIMQAYHFQILVDLYGDVPYTGALQREQNTTPEYDEADQIYDDLLVKLNTAQSVIDSTASTNSPTQVGDDDTMFGGDMDMWTQFANTLKIRILARLSDTKEANFINDELANISGGYITDDAIINPGYVQEEGKQNPFWDDFARDVSGSEINNYDATPATQFVVNFFQETDDPRIDYIFEEPDEGHKGVNQGADNNSDEFAPAMVSNFNLEEGIGILKGPDMGSVILTLAEHKLNMAELVVEGFNVSGSAQTYYEEGVRASFAYLGVPDSMATAYLTSNTENVSWSNSPNKLNAIMTQNWLATMGITAEQAWFDYNRTGYPNAEPVGAGDAPETGTTGFPMSEDAASEDDRPVRLAYPSSEITRNGSNVPSQPDVFGAKIFWAN